MSSEFTTLTTATRSRPSNNTTSNVSTVSTTYSLGDSRAKGDVVGSLSVDGPLDDTTVELRLAGDIEDPSPWWRLTHPLELFGLTD